jgi:hypothetical protein
LFIVVGCIASFAALSYTFFFALRHQVIFREARPNRLRILIYSIPVSARKFPNTFNVYVADLNKPILPDTMHSKISIWISKVVSEPGYQG